MTATPGEILRARGLRSTPQRRAILAVFQEDAGHLSADEVYATASRALPDLGRGTVYATLAEFTQSGLLATFGTPDPVRYELNTAPHAHFRCRLCRRIFDLPVDARAFVKGGFVVERVETRAEGVCAECTAYEERLRRAARAMGRTGPPVDALGLPGVAAAEVPGPLGALLLAATADGLVRVAFDDHADAGALHAHAAGRRGSQAARAHLATAREQLDRYFAGEPGPPEAPIDWARLAEPDAVALRAAGAIPWGDRRSYSDLGVDAPAGELGRIMGSNPVPIVVPCHRVTRGTEAPDVFVGGVERRRWLERHEREHGV